MSAVKQYRKKPVVIEAMEFTPETGPDVWEWADSKPMKDSDGNVFALRIFTLEGGMKANFGDFIIKGVNGEFYPCKPDIFAKTYEAAEEPAA